MQGIFCKGISLLIREYVVIYARIGGELTRMMDHLQKKKAGILKALAHPVRIGIVEVLEDREMCVCDIAERFTLDRTSISKHLALMKNLDILDDRREGLHVYYSLRMKCLPTLLKCIEMVSQGQEPQASLLTCTCAEETKASTLFTTEDTEEKI